MPRTVNNPAKRLFATIVGVVILAAGGATAVWMLRGERLPPTDAAPIDLLKFAASDRFADLPDDTKRVYFDALMKNPRETFLAALNSDLTDEQRDEILFNGMVSRMTARLDEWMKLDEAGKKRYVDDLVKTAKQRAATRPSRVPGVAAAARAAMSGARGPRPMSPARQKRMVENLQPDRRAALPEMLSEIRKAREAAK